MTTINDITDLARILREHPEWAETLRSILLTKELLELPQVVATLVQSNETINRRLDNLEADVATLKEDVGALKEKVAIIEEKVAVIEEDVAILKADVAELKTDVADIKSDLGPLKGAHTRNGAERSYRRIARTLNCAAVQLVDDEWLYNLTQDNPTGDIPDRVLQSFEEADLVIDARHRDSGEACYIAVEASFTAGRRDVERAVRNADLLRRFTGQPAYAVVAANVIPDSLAEELSRSGIHWYQVEAKYIQAR